MDVGISVSFVAFVLFVAWGWGSSEDRARQIENAKPNLVFTETRETPLFDDKGKPSYHGLQAWFVNRPKVSSDNSIAEDVTARITFYDKSTKNTLGVYGLWILGEAYDFSGFTGAVNKMGKMPPNDEPCKLAIAVKWQEDEKGYAFVKESLIHSPSGDCRESIRAIGKGDHYVSVHIRGTRLDQPPVWFLMANPGEGGDLSLSSPIKKPNLQKEGFVGHV